MSFLSSAGGHAILKAQPPFVGVFKALSLFALVGERGKGFSYASRYILSSAAMSCPLCGDAATRSATRRILGGVLVLWFDNFQLPLFVGGEQIVHRLFGSGLSQGSIET